MRKGSHHSPETVRRMAENARNASTETRHKISASMMGRKNALGHKVSKEARQKISKANTGRKHTELSCKHMGDSHRGFVFSAESRKKMSESAKRVPLSSRRRGYKLSAESKARISVANTGRKRSAEYCHKMSLAMKGKGPSLEIRQKAIIANTGKHRSEETKQKLSAIHKGRTMSKAWRKKIAKAHIGLSPSAEARKKIGAKHKELWAKTSIEERHRRTHAGRKAVCSPSGLEKIVHQHLRKAGVKFQPQKAFRPYFVDIFIPKLNLVVECDGTYWHNRPGAWEQDRKRDRYLISRYGVRVVRVPEKSIRENPKFVVSTILKGEGKST